MSRMSGVATRVERWQGGDDGEVDFDDRRLGQQLVR